jgi:hypothetical protein
MLERAEELGYEIPLIIKWVYIPSKTTPNLDEDGEPEL